MMSRTSVKLLFVGIVLALAAGCASTKDLKALQSEVDSLKTQVQATDDKASRALSEAQAAKSQADMTDDKIDRMFQKSMLK
jgi:outer membrane murein-binding lipoprotein Lpp